MKFYLTLITFLGLSLLTAQTAVDFESLAIDSFRNGSTANGSFDLGNVRLPNNYNSTFDSWTGWALSSETDTTTPGFMNQYSAFPGGGAGGSANYGVSFGVTNVLYLEDEALGTVIDRISVTNTTYAALSMRDGDGFAKKFGGVTGNDPDFFLLTIKGYRDGAVTPDSVDFFLADYRFADNRRDYIVDDWQTIDLISLGAVDSLQFTMTSTDVTTFGIATPTYFAIDNITGAALTPVSNPGKATGFRVFPNPTAGKLTLLTPAAATGGTVRLYTARGKLMRSARITSARSTLDLGHLPAGSYWAIINQGGRVLTHKVIKY